MPRASSQIARVEGHSPRRSVRSLVTTARDSRATTVTDGANPSIWSNGLRASPSTACPFELPNYVVGRAATKQAAGLLVGTVWPQVSTSCTSFAVATVGCMSARPRISPLGWPRTNDGKGGGVHCRAPASQSDLLRGILEPKGSDGARPPGEAMERGEEVGARGRRPRTGTPVEPVPSTPM